MYLTRDELAEIDKEARAELASELRRRRIDAEKERLRTIYARGRWWHRFIPFTVSVSIKRRDHV